MNAYKALPSNADMELICVTTDEAWTWNATEYNHFSNTAVTLSPGGKLVGSRAETVAAGPYGLAFPLTDAR